MAGPEEGAAPAPPRRSEPRRPRAAVAFAFALAALLAAWNPIAAPFGLVVGVTAAMLAVRAMRRTPRPRIAVAALVLGAFAIAASIAVILLTAGAVGVDLPGDPVVKGRTPEELEKVLSDAAVRTRAERERASRELGNLVGARPGVGASPAPDAGAAAPRRDGGEGEGEPP
jgi:hypothetical protein